MQSGILKRVLYGIAILLPAGSILMLMPRAYGILNPEKAPVGYHFLWTSYLAIAIGLEDLIDTNPVVPEEIEAVRNVAYKNINGESLQLDFYKRRDIESPAPLVIFVHGGSWKKGKREDMLPLMIDCAQRGYVTATISYRLNGYPRCVEDVSDALAWFYEHGDQYGYDADRIAIVGASAGAHLAMMAAYGWRQQTPDLASFEGSHRIKALIDLFGPVDLTTDYAKHSSGAAWFIGKPYSDAPELYAEASPLQYLDQDAPPTMIIHGTSDELVPNSQADQLHHHIDTHMGTLYGSPGYAKVFFKVAEEYNIPTNAIDMSDPEVVGKFRKQGYPINDAMIAVAKDYRLPKLDNFGSVPTGSTYGEKRDNFFALVKSLKPGLTEIIFHPSVESKNLKSITNSWQQRVWEAQLFSDPVVHAFFEKEGIVQTNWREIMKRFGEGR